MKTMHSCLLSLVSGMVACAIGVVLGIVGKAYLENRLAHKVHLWGVIQYQPAPNPSLSVPPPEGFYVTSSALERVYLDKQVAEPFLNKAILASGKLRTICGQNQGVCYPRLVTDRVRMAKPRTQN